MKVSWVLVLLEGCKGYELEFHSEPPQGTAGEAFGIQPVVKILDNQGSLDTNFLGYAYAELYNTPTGVESVWSNGSTDVLRVPFVEGYATFTGLYVKVAGDGYTLRIVGEDDDFDEFAYVISSPFDVEAGAPYAMELVGAPSSGTGGTPFGLQPRLRIVDVGGNVVSDWSQGTVTASMNKKILRPTSMLVQPVKDGIVQFAGLYIYEADQNYIITFRASDDVQLAGPQTVSMLPLTITVGPPATLSFWQTLPLTSSSRAGHAFARQPILRIADVANNTITDDSASYLVIASIVTNPTGTDFISRDAAFAFSDQSQVAFSNLGLKLVGERYALRFVLFEYSDAQTIADTGIFIDTHRFDVVLGPPHELRVTRDPFGATAGSSAFPEQPIVAIYDRGGNVLTDENDDLVEADIALSLGGSDFSDDQRIVSIDTSGEAPSELLRLETAVLYLEEPEILNSGLYLVAAGDVVEITAVFQSDVLLQGEDLSLELAMDNASRPAFADLIQEDLGRYTSRQRFHYVVRPGDGTSLLDLASAKEDWTAVDPLGRAVNATLPIRSSTKGALTNFTTLIQVQTTAPQVVDVRLATPASSGVYAAGTRLEFNVSFDTRVVVEVGLDGGPFLPVGNLNSSITPLATYFGGSGSKILQFVYDTLADDHTNGGFVGLPENTTLSTPSGTFIYARAATPTTFADLLVRNTTTIAKRVVIDVTPPRVNRSRGIFGISRNGSYYAGDVVDLAVEFDLPVSISVSTPPFLTLDTGVGVPVAATYLRGDGTKRLVFRYAVFEDDSKDGLEVYDAGALQTGGWVRRYVGGGTPLVDADLSLKTIFEDRQYLLSNTSYYNVDGTKPVIVNYGCVCEYNATKDGNVTTFGMDDVVTIRVVFDKPVVVFGVPALRLDVGSLERFALYAGGNGTTSLDFEYTVQIGDATERLGLVTNVATVATRVSQNIFDLTTSQILLASSEPMVDADLTVYFSKDASRFLGAPIYTSPGLSNLNTSVSEKTHFFMKIDALTPRPTTIATVEYDDPTTMRTSVGAGERLVFAVTFTDEVPLDFEPPELQLNTGGRALWVDGAGTKRWRFRYIVEADATYVQRLDIAPISNDGLFPHGHPRQTAIFCNFTAACALNDRAGNEVNLTMRNMSAISHGMRNYPVEIDVTPPQVASIRCRTPPSPYVPGPNGPYKKKANWYTVGERLEFAVKFDREIALLSDDGPLLQLGLAGPRYAGFEAMESTTVLRFSYVVQPGDATNNLTVVALTNNLEQAELYRLSSAPTTLINYTLPPSLRGAMVPANGTLDTPLRIATDRIPKVYDVRFVGLDNTTTILFAPGDQVAIEVEFDAAVSVEGEPVLLMNSALEARAFYVTGSGTPVLTFEYIVKDGDMTLHLGYTDTNALRRNVIEESATPAEKLAGRGWIRGASSTPTLNADLELPVVGSMRSLTGSGKVTIRVDSTVPRLLKLRPRGIFGAITASGTSIFVEAIFSAPVAVNGRPQIRLETGTVDRAANYYNGSNTSTLLFHYVVEPGDSTSRLDYVSDVDNFRSSKTALEFPTTDSWIRRASMDPIVEADSLLNPVQAILLSNGVYYVDNGKAIPFEGGVAEYADLAIALFANDYRLRFSCAHTALDGLVLRTSTDFHVNVSIDTVIRVGDAITFDARVLEFQEAGAGFTYSHAEEAHDLFGWSVDADRNAGKAGLVVGCGPGKARPLPEIQLVTLLGGVDSYDAEVLEVQSYGVGVFLRPAVQSFVIESNPGTTLDGTFELQYADTDGLLLAAGADVPISADATSAAQLLMEAYPDLGLVTATKEPYPWCACSNGAVWRITFDGLINQPRVGEIKVDTSFLTFGIGARVSAIVREVENAYVNGTWHLEMPEGVYSGIEVKERKKTRALSAEATTRDLLDAIEEDLAPLLVKNVELEDVNSYGGRHWAVTFAQQVLPHFTNDVPDLEAVPEPSLLRSGPGANAWAYTIQQGESPVTGSFRLNWRNSLTPTPLIPYNASETELEEALLTLSSISKVRVSRHPRLLGSGFSWLVTFLGVNALLTGTTNIWIPTALGDLEKIEVTDIASLLGSKPTITVSKAGDVPSWTGVRKGTNGRGAGSCYIYERTTVSEADDSFAWAPMFALEPQHFGHYRGETMAFGHSVAFAKGGGNNGIVLVGAPFAEEHGVKEQQRLTCLATDGFFRVGMRGFWSDPIHHNATIEEFKDAITGPYRTLTPLHPTPAVQVTSLGGLETICSSLNNTAGNATNATIGVVITFLTPTSGPGVDGTSIADLDPIEIDASRLHGGTITVVEVRKGTWQPHGFGALGDARGAAFLYRYRPNEAVMWQQKARFVEYAEAREGDRFGWSVSILAPPGELDKDSEMNLVAAIGAPSAGANREGLVFVFAGMDPFLYTEEQQAAERVSSGFFQRVGTPLTSAVADPAEESDEFGYSVAMSLDDSVYTLLVGAPGDDDDAGAAYVFRADGVSLALAGEFRFVQRFDANSSGIGSRRSGDRFGCSVALDGNDVVIGACGASDASLRGYLIEEDDAEHAGYVAVYKRATVFDLYEYKQRLRPTNNVAGDRFGTAVAVDNGTIIATGLQGIRNIGEKGVVSDAPLQPRQSVWAVQTAMDNPVAPMGGTFRLGWRATNTSEVLEACSVLPMSLLVAESCSMIAAASLLDPNIPGNGSIRWTRELPAAASALQIRTALEEDLMTGDLFVSRSVDLDLQGSGYQWNITFRADVHEHGFFQGLPPVIGDGSGLIANGGQNPRLTVRQLVERPEYVRGNGHLFSRKENYAGEAIFVEQAILRPYLIQRQSLFGLSAALSGDMGVIGAPNHDSDVSGVNAGSISAYDLSFLSLEFNTGNVNVTEGETAEFFLSRKTNAEGIFGMLNDRRLYAFIFTVSRNVQTTMQEFLRQLFGLYDSRSVPPGKTYADVLGSGTAHGRAQYYGGSSNSSAWVDGGRDDLGVSDFIPLGLQSIIKPGDAAVAVTLETVNDALLERPDETADVVLWLPGMFASGLGDLHVRVRIDDDGDGRDATTAVFEKLGDSPDNLVATFTRADIHKGVSVDDYTAATLNERRGGSVVAAYVTASEDLVVLLGTQDKEAKDDQVLVYRRSSADGFWRFEAKLTNSSSSTTPFYGAAVAGDDVYGRADGGETILVAAPGAATVFAYVYTEETSNASSSGNTTTTTTRMEWQPCGILRTEDAVEARDQFGAAVALDGDTAAVGAPGLEAVYIYYRRFSTTTRTYEWDSSNVLIIRSSEYDYDVRLGGTRLVVHEQGFGAAVALSQNGLAVGAPFADYGNRGDLNDRETRDTNGIDNKHLGKGKVFTFESKAPEILVTVRADEPIVNGSWKLGLPTWFRSPTAVGANDTSFACQTSELDYFETAANVQAALDAACVVGMSLIAGQISVSRDATTSATYSGGERMTWTITFKGEVAESALPLVATWNGHGCSSCRIFNGGWARNPEAQVLIEAATRGSWTETAVLQPPDRTSGSRFGAAVDLDEDQLIVGAPLAAGAAETTWDFETGDLMGWRRTGTAFDHQPTFGDGPAYRPDTANDVFGTYSSLTVSGTKARAARPRGRYFVGTSDDRPGDATDYTLPEDGTKTGDKADDEGAVGSLTSEPVALPFLHSSSGKKYGDRLVISFLVGGGCDPLTEYVELLVDGVAVARATGRCDERMYNTTWDVTAFAGRTAVIRIVDASASPSWGHLNVDHIGFSWPTRWHGQGELLGSPKRPHFASTSDWAGLVGLAGAAYVYRKEEDVWTSSGTRLTPSDRRSGDFFGSSVAIDASSGLAVVGAPYADARTHWQVPPPRRPPGVGPRRDSPLSSAAQTDVLTAYENTGGRPPYRATPVVLPLEEASALRMATTSSVRSPSGAATIWAQRKKDEANGLVDEPPHPSIDEARDAGAVYVFDQSPAVVDSNNNELIPPRWSPIEVAKITNPSAFARDLFGTAVAALPSLIAVGAPGDDSYGINAGAAFVYDPRALRLRFASAEFSVVEGFDPTAQIIIERDPDDSGLDVTVAYTTEDLSAKGVDDVKLAACQGITVTDSREGCGDYRQTMGTLTLSAGATSNSFYVPIIDDDCYEHYSEYVQLSFSIPGAPALVGEHFIAKLRIDDDDFSSLPCTYSFL